MVTMTTALLYKGHTHSFHWSLNCHTSIHGLKHKKNVNKSEKERTGSEYTDGWGQNGESVSVHEMGGEGQRLMILQSRALVSPYLR